MNEKDLISIIVPVYNAEKFLARCVNSILAQTYKNIEVLLVDDGSNDSSPLICDDFELKDSRVKVIHQDNAGVSAARNTGLRHFSGSYYCFVDSDDEVDQFLIEKLYFSARETNADLTICGYKQIFGERERIFEPSKACVKGKFNIASYYLDHYLEWIASAPWAKLFKVNEQSKNLIFDEGMSLGEDLKYNVEYIKITEVVSVISDSLYKYYIYNDVKTLSNHYNVSYYYDILELYQSTNEYIYDLNSTAALNIKNVNYKLFSFCVSFMSQNIGVGTRKESIVFIKEVVNNDFLRGAVLDLPKISFVKRVYVIAIRYNMYNFLYVLSWLKYMLLDKRR